MFQSLWLALVALQYYTLKEHCVVPEKIHTHLMEGHWKFLGGGRGGGGGGLKAKFLEAISWGRGVQNKKLSMGGVWIFSGTAHFRFAEVFKEFQVKDKLCTSAKHSVVFLS